MSWQVRNGRNVIATQIEVVEMKRRFFGVHDSGELIVTSFDRGKKFQSIEVFQGIETIERKINFFQKFELSNFLNQKMTTWIAGSFLWVQTKSLKANVVPQLVFPKLQRQSLKFNCCSLNKSRITKDWWQLHQCLTRWHQYCWETG